MSDVKRGEAMFMKVALRAADSNINYSKQELLGNEESLVVTHNIISDNLIRSFHEHVFETFFLFSFFLAILKLLIRFANEFILLCYVFANF